jgi:Sulfotransferase domain
VTLSIIGAGLGRTGTLSLKRALEQLGVGPCFHGVDTGRDTFDRVLRAVHHDQVNWEEVFAGYRAVVDVPAYIIYRRLVEQFPAAKVILTVREPNAWFESSREVKRAAETLTLTNAETEFFDAVRSGNFGTDIAEVLALRDRETAIAAHQRHNAGVRECIPAERLLEFDVTRGWKPLCEFLGVPVPNSPFPSANSRKQFHSMLQTWAGGSGAETHS